MLGMLAGAFIGLGALYYAIVVSDPALPHAVQRVLGGAVFSLGLLLVVVAGAELFTGNNLIALAWADGKVSTGELAFNWVVVCCANFAGAVGLARGSLRRDLPQDRRGQDLASLDPGLLQRRDVQRAGLHGDMDDACRS
jgi:hypothetical protein